MQNLKSLFSSYDQAWKWSGNRLAVGQHTKPMSPPCKSSQTPSILSKLENSIQEQSKHSRCVNMWKPVVQLDLCFHVASSHITALLIFVFASLSTTSRLCFFHGTVSVQHRRHRPWSLEEKAFLTMTATWTPLCLRDFELEKLRLCRFFPRISWHSLKHSRWSGLLAHPVHSWLNDPQQIPQDLFA